LGNLFLHDQTASPSKNKEIEEGVTTEPVCAMDGNTGTFSCPIKTGDNPAFVVRQDSSIRIGGNPSHDVMAGRSDRDEIVDRIDP